MSQVAMKTNMSVKSSTTAAYNNRNSTAVGNTIFLVQQRTLWGCNIKHRLCIIIVNRLLFWEFNFIFEERQQHNCTPM